MASKKKGLPLKKVEKAEGEGKPDKTSFATKADAMRPKGKRLSDKKM